MESPPAFVESEKETLLNVLLAKVPPHEVAALGPDGYFVPLPTSLRVADQSVSARGSSGVDLVVPADIILVVEAWERVLVVGIARQHVHLASNPARSVEMILLDARYRFGVFLLFLLGSESPADAPAGDVPRHRVRVAKMRKSGFAIIEHIDTAVTQMLGWTSEDMLGRRSLEYVHPDDRARAIAHWMETAREPNSERRVRFRHKHRDGSWLWLEVTNRKALADLAQASVDAEMVDISDEMAALEALRAREQLLLLLTETLPLGILQVDAERRIVHRNKRLITMLGNEAATTLEEQLSGVDPGEQTTLHALLDATFAGGSGSDVELTLHNCEIALRCSFSMRPLTAENGRVSGAIVCIADITERARLNEKLEFRATYDALTHCQNRASILALLETTLRGAIQTSGGVALLFIDLDHFKEINDRLGHGAGDAVLQRTGERLIGLLREGDAVGRLGGDEFLVICPNVKGPDTALDIACRISNAIAESVAFEGSAIAVASSIGVAWTDAPVDSKDFVAAADAAMYASKRSGGSQPVLADRRAT